MFAKSGVYGNIPIPKNKIAIQPISIKGSIISTKQKDIRNPIKRIGGKNASIHLEIF